MPGRLAAPRPRERVLAAPSPTLCLDYCNTRYWRGQAAPTETLPDVTAWRQWLQQARVVDSDSASHLQAMQRDDAAAATRLFGDALQLREALYDTFAAMTAGALPAAGARRLVQWLDAAPPRATLVLEGSEPGWRVPMAAPTLSDLLAPVLWSAADLVLAPGTQPLRCCANPQCRWLFVDGSKGATRRWCAMSACGNRAKVQRHAQRQRALRNA